MFPVIGGMTLSPPLPRGRGRGGIVPSVPAAGPAEVIEGSGGLICAHRLSVVFNRKTRMIIKAADKGMDFIFRVHLPV